MNLSLHSSDSFNVFRHLLSWQIKYGRLWLRKAIQTEKDSEKEEYMHNPAREEDPRAERSSEEVWMEGSFWIEDVK